MPSPTTPVAVFLGGCLGGLARYEIGLAWPVGAHAFPVSTLLVNLTGAFALGALVAAASGPPRAPHWLRPALGTGFCGAYTTFASVVTTADLLGAHARPALAAAYLLASLGGGLVMVVVGLLTGSALSPRKDPAW